MARQARLQGLIVGSRKHQTELIRAIEATGIKPVVDAASASMRSLMHSGKKPAAIISERSVGSFEQQAKSLLGMAQTPEGHSWAAFSPAMSCP
jgi:hypothetical protein